MNRFYAPPENFDTNEITLNLDETRHLRDVLRFSDGDKIAVFDGNGMEFLCEIGKIEKKKTRLKILEKISPAASESNLNLTLAVALLKGEKFDLTIQKAVELGVTKFVPLITKRCDVKPKPDEKKLERQKRIVIESSKQCGRAQLMKIETPLDFGKFVENSKSARSENELLLLFSEKSGEKFSGVKQSKKITAVIGSEGGFEMSEIDSAKDSGFQIITFAGRILRAETAAISIAAILQNRFGDLS